MKQVTVTGERQAAVIDVPEPKVRGNWAKVKVMSAPMCTEVKGFIKGDGGHGYGHEAVGEVVEVARPCRVKVGDRVVVQPGTPCGVCDLCIQGEYIHCRHWHDFKEFSGGETGLATMAQYVLKADWLLSPIPKGVSYDMASLAICGLGPTFEAFDVMAVDAFDTVLITGLGAVGLGGVLNACYRGARVIAVDSNKYRADLASELGADVVLDPGAADCLDAIIELTGGQGVDKAVDCSGVVAAHRLAIDATRRKGRVSFVGQCHDETPITISKDMIQKGLTLHGVWHYNLSAYPRVMQVIEELPAAEKLITHTFSIDDIQKAWEIQASGECGKVILKPWE